MIPPGASTRGGQLRDPREAIAQLRQQLALHWSGRVYQGDGRGLSVLSISPELTVWCNGRVFIWHERGRPLTHPAADPVTAAVRLIHRLQQLQQARPLQQPPQPPAQPSQPPPRQGGQLPGQPDQSEHLGQSEQWDGDDEAGSAGAGGAEPSGA